MPQDSNIQNATNYSGPVFLAEQAGPSSQGPEGIKAAKLKLLTKKLFNKLKNYYYYMASIVITRIAKPMERKFKVINQLPNKYVWILFFFYIQP